MKKQQIIISIAFNQQEFSELKSILKEFNKENKIKTKRSTFIKYKIFN